jgi:adenylate cyclase class 1
MVDGAEGKTANPAALRKQLLDGRKAFGNYNVVRLGRLIRRLSEEGRRVFETVPILLHLNTSGLPGHVDHPLTPHGVFLLSESGFWKTGRERLNIDPGSMKDFLLKRYPVRGIYLAGSGGTCAQTRVSDLNYWVLIDSETVDEEQRDLFSIKLAGIQAWALEDHGQALTFQVLDPDQFRRNHFPACPGSSPAAPHGSFTKEEFYRTLMLIAGRIPFWAVLPVGLDPAGYRRWVDGAGLVPDQDFAADDYVDLGCLTALRGEECPGALLSEICRFREDPVRAMLRASLAAHHYFFQEDQGLLCESIKGAFCDPASGDASADPSLYAFKRAARFHESMDDAEGLDLIRTCICLRLSGYPGPRLAEEAEPNREVLNRCRREWGWSSAHGDRIGAYADWREDERLAMEDRILQRLWFLWRLVVKARDVRKAAGQTAPSRLDALQRRLKQRLSPRPGQIPCASSYLRAARFPTSFHVARQKDATGSDRWAVYDRPNIGSQIDATALFTDARLVCTLGWLVLNGLCRNDPSSAMRLHGQSTIVERRARDFLEALIRTFSGVRSTAALGADAAWVRLLVVLDIGLGARKPDLPPVGFLVQNTWGEMFFFPQALDHVENRLLRCYEIAKRVWQLQTEAPSGEFDFRIHHSHTAEEAQAAKDIEAFVRSWHSDKSGNPFS